MSSAKINKLLNEVGASLPADGKFDLLRLMYSNEVENLDAERLQAVVAKVKEITKRKGFNVNLIHNLNSAMLVALNRYVHAEVVQAMVNGGAEVDKKSPDGRLLAEMMFDSSVSEDEKLQAGLRCYQRANEGVKLSEDSKAFIASDDFKKITQWKPEAKDAQKPADPHAAPSAKPQLSDKFKKVDKLFADFESGFTDKSDALLKLMYAGDRETITAAKVQELVKAGADVNKKVD